MARGRPISSQIRQNIIEILFYLKKGYGYSIARIYNEIFPPVHIRSIYYHLRKGVATKEITLEEIKDSVNSILEEGNKNLVLLHCISDYPAKVEEANLEAINQMKKEFDLPVGFSDHSVGTTVTLASAALGANVIERHFTLDRTMKGSDHASSVEPPGMELIVNRTKKIFKAIGSPEKKVYDCELANRKKFRGY